MTFSELVEASHIPGRDMAFCILIVGWIFVIITFWLPSSLYSVYYMSSSMIFAAVLYITFWGYKAGYKIEALRLAIKYTAIYTIALVFLIYARDQINALQNLVQNFRQIAFQKLSEF